MDQNGGADETHQRKRARTEGCPPHNPGNVALDRISTLPDTLLLHILSFLGVTGAIATSGVSRRWRYLWHSLPSLDFSTLPWRGMEWSPDWLVDWVLLRHAAPRVELFRLIVVSRGGGPIDSWVLFAVRRDVRVLDLDIQVDNYRYYSKNPKFFASPDYGLPPCLFGCGSLEVLNLQFCSIRLPTHVCLSSLKTMKLSCVHFEDGQLKRLLSGCPLLQSLTLGSCKAMGNLDISAGMNRHLEILEVSDDVCISHSPFGMQIFSPSLKYLSFSGSVPRAWYRVTDLSSLIAASFRLDEGNGLAFGNFVAFADLLVRICRLQVLKLCSWCLQALSIREVQGLCLPPCFTVASLELSMGLQKWELPGILCAFRACSKLRILNIHIQSKKIMEFDGDVLDVYDFDEIEYLRSSTLSFQNAMQHLKTIRIQGFMGYEHINVKGKKCNSRRQCS